MDKNKSWLWYCLISLIAYIAGIVYIANAHTLKGVVYLLLGTVWLAYLIIANIKIKK